MAKAPTTGRVHARPSGRRARRRIRRSLAVLVGAGVIVGASTLPAATAASTGAEKDPVLSPRLASLARPEAAARSASGQNGDVGLPASGAGSLLRHGRGAIVVDVRVSNDAALDAAAANADADVIARRPGLGSLAIAPSDLLALGATRGVISASEVLTPTIASAPARPTTPADPTAASASCPSGVVSQGDAQLRGAVARSQYGVDGSGIKVGVLSDSYNRLGTAANDVASGDLPGAGNPCGHTTAVRVLSEGGSGADEGRAMLQIVHDLAPRADLLFASAFNGDVDFANQIIALKNAGAKVIVDDVSYLNEPFYQDGVIAAAIDNVKAAGVSYFSSAGNSTRTVAGKSVGSYEALSYRPTTCPSGVAEAGLADCHDFNPGGGTDATDRVTVPNNGAVAMTLGWSEPQFGVKTDLDFFVLDATSHAVVAVSNTDSIADGTASEFLSFLNSSGAARSFDVVVGRYAGSATPRLKWISHSSPLTAVEWNTSAGGDVMGPTTFGHNAALAAATIAAVPFNNSAVVEPFSSEGPAFSCWQPVNGSTPAASKPCATKNIDFAATDGVVTTVPSPLNPFYGTSAAAPHAAAVNALMRQARPCRTVDELRTAEARSGRAVGSFGTASVGSGLVDAPNAIANLSPCDAQPQLSIGDGAIVEGDSSSRSLRFAVTLSAPSTQNVSATYVAASGDATAGSDFTSTSGTVTVPAGSTSASVSVAVRGDTAVEAKESFSVWLGSPQHATLSRVAGIGLILNDDAGAGLRVAVGDASVVEGRQGSRSLRFTISLSARSTSNVSVAYATANGTAVAGSDYTSRAGTVTIAAGSTSATVSISIRADAVSEALESFKLTLSSPTGATIGRTNGVGRIIDDD